MLPDPRRCRDEHPRHHTGHARLRPDLAIIRRLAATCALAVTAVGLSVPAASAGESERIRTDGGVVEFQASGDILRALDTRRDGYAVRAHLTWFDPQDSTLQKEWVTDPNSAGVS
jgi:hypothetical protein